MISEQSSKYLLKAIWAWFILFFAFYSVGQTTTGTLRGKVTDPSGAVVTDATVSVSGGGQSLSATTNHQGIYEIKTISAGKYSVSATAQGFSPYSESDVEVAAGQVQQFDIALDILVQKEKVEVQEEGTTVGVAPSENASSLIIKDKDLEALSDDPDELQNELTALAGPSVGPNGGQIYIDGFTGGQLPPKSSIREIRVNQNPFSAEYDKLGYGRIEILTKPGTDKFHGQVFFNESHSALNSLNPFLAYSLAKDANVPAPSYHSEMYNGSIGGPVNKKSSFFLDFQRRNINDLAIVNALVPDPNQPSNPNGLSLVSSVPNPNTRTNISPRIDYQLTPNNTLNVRYQFEQEKQDNEGIGGTTLASQAYNESSTENTLQISDTQIFGANIVNETRFQYLHDNDSSLSVSSAPSVQVLGFFSNGGNSQQNSRDYANHYELQDYTSIAHGKHLLKFGGRLRDVKDSSYANSGFNGVFTFSSLAAYQVTQLGLQNGLTQKQSRAACLAASTSAKQADCGASQLTLTTGQPNLENNYLDMGLYAEDTWRARQNLSLTYGLRYETQNSIHDHADFAPRVGLAWGLARNGGTPKTVLRAGFGMFYDRFQQQYVLLAQRLNGTTQQQSIFSYPDCYPDPAGCQGGTASNTVRQIAPGLRAPYTIQSAASLERQLTKAANVSVTYLNSRGVHEFRSRNINAPLDGTYDPANPASAVCPYGCNAGNIDQFESRGTFKQNQVIVNARVSAGAKLSLFGFYMLNFANSDVGSATTFLSDQYNIAKDYGRAIFDVRHRLFIGGSVTLPYAFHLNPFIIVNSGQPFNLTIGQDLNGDSLFNDRPAMVSTTTCGAVTRGANTVCSPWGTFSTNSISGNIVPINYGTGPGSATVNLRLSRTFGFGTEAKGGSGQGGKGGPGGPGGFGGRRGGPPGGGLGPGGLSGGGGGPNMFGGGTNRRYNLTFSISARNLLNSRNLATPVGNVNSADFGQSIAIAGGPFGSSTANRRYDMQVVFAF